MFLKEYLIVFTVTHWGGSCVVCQNISMKANLYILCSGFNPWKFIFQKEQKLKNRDKGKFISMLFSLDSSVIFNCRDENANVIYFSEGFSLLNSCDSQHCSIKKWYLQTLWNAAVAWHFFFSYNIKVFEVQLCSRGESQFLWLSVVDKKVHSQLKFKWNVYICSLQ